MIGKRGLRRIDAARRAALIALVAFFAVLGGTAAVVANAPTPPPQSGVDATRMIAHGGDVYRATCAMCHDHPNERMPSFGFLKQSRPPEYIVRVLTIGAMRDIAAGLGAEDKNAVAAFITGRPPHAETPIALDANRCTAPAPPMTVAEPSWNGWGGGGVANARFQPKPGFTAAQVGRLKVKWAFALPGGIYNGPVAVGGRVFVGSMAGTVFSLDARTGCTYWAKDLGSPTRTSIIVDHRADGRFVAYASTWWGDLVALDAITGQEIWRMRPDEHASVRLTGTPLLDRDRLYVPISSGEEGAAQDPNYVCCTLRGWLVAVDTATGKPIWRSPTIDRPAAPVPGDGHRMGPAGASIWSTPSIDRKRQLIYAVTGNDHADPGTDASDAIIAYDLATGRKRWSHQVTHDDRFVGGCEDGHRHRNCPSGTIGPDYGFGSSPIPITLPSGRDIVVAMSKNGVAYGFDPDAGGQLVWQTRLGRGGMLGGAEWGGATDGDAVFVPISDFPYPGMSTATIGGWGLSPGIGAVSPATGKLIWRVPAPRPACSWKGPCEHAHAAAALAMPGVVFAGSFDGHERAYAARDGRLLWDFDTAVTLKAVNAPAATGGTIDHGAHALADGTLFVTSGSRTAQQGNALIAFTVDGR